MAELTSFIPADLEIKKWDDIEPYFTALQESNPQTTIGLQRLIRHYSDITCVVLENWGRAGINYWSNTLSQHAKERMEMLLNALYVPTTHAEHAIEKKIVEHPSFRKLDERYGQVRRAIRWSLDSYGPAHIDLDVESEKVSMRCEEITGALTAQREERGGEVPLSLLEGDLRSNDRQEREHIWRLINDKRMEIKDQIDAYFNTLVHLRHRIGVKAGHPNYRRYQHWGPYPQHTPRQAHRFHNVIERVVVPLAEEITDRQRKRLGLSTLRPWDSDSSRWGVVGTPPHEESPHPFDTTDELIDKSIEVFSRLKPVFGRNLETMREACNFDLDPRKGKSVFTGYCMYLEATGVPFVSMNASGSSSDVETKMHEDGHAVHMFATLHDPLIFRRDVDLTMAETASISMEFLSMKHWDVFYDEEQCSRAMRNKLEEAIRFLPWCAVVDKFQQWLYSNPKHTAEERDSYFAHLMDRFYPSNISWKGLERYRRNLWQKQDHIISTPFYYIDYGFALLRALQIYRNSLLDHKKAVNDYYKGLRMGGSKPYPRVWEVMSGKRYIPPGSRYFGPMVEEIMRFVMEQLEELDD